jgi:hypothetical protein
MTAVKTMEHRQTMKVLPGNQGSFKRQTSAEIVGPRTREWIWMSEIAGPLPKPA